jgi:hypothetical protein
MTKMDTVEDADGEKEGAGQVRELRNRVKDLHHENYEYLRRVESLKR